ncbi:hypothetical protein [Microlunatus soli]|uniref:YndJ-like protein n=1 Tax=Microlunatus soli TaxID=630515 RepID=A0A1H1NLC9_9ACTN|nr:hypothetical protein [Microlunatus soli]SDR99782.1 hypothetical protein SAMN04489812_0559 [Microlunatus soli]
MRTHPLDIGSRKLWRTLGREVDLDGDDSWLRSPTSPRDLVADGWLQDGAAVLGGSLIADDHDAGLLGDLSELDGPGFTAADLHPQVRDFYHHTARYRIEVWSSWTPIFWPPGEMISRLWGRRLQQLALPMRPLDVAHGMDSRVLPIRDADGRQLAAGWLRSLRSTGDYVYSGCYLPRKVPGEDRLSLVVSFPLQSGNMQAVLQPHVLPGGALRLESPPGPFGSAGTYVLVEDGGRTFVRRLPVHETFVVYVDDEGVVRTDHVLRVFAAPAFRLHYRLDRLG